MLPTNSIEPVTRHEVEKRFHDFIQKPENRGFNTAFARWLGHADDSHVSRMHSPFVSEVPSWLWKAADKLDKACRANLTVGKFALSILAWVVSRHEQGTEPVTVNSFESSYHNLRAVLANREDGLATDEQVEEAKQRHAEATARVGNCRNESLREQKV
jgi:hypothetical protein